MKKINPHARLIRIPDCFIPVALAASSVFQGPLTLKLYACWLATGLLALFTARGLRIAIATQPSVRTVRGSVACALIAQCVGLALALAACPFAEKRLNTSLLPFIIAGFLLNIEHMFYEFLHSLGDGRSATLSHGLSALFLAAGISLSTGPLNTQRLFLIPAMAGLSALVAAVVGLTLGGLRRGRLNAAVLRVAPRAALQTLLYPLLAGAALLIRPDIPFFPLFIGLAVFELCRTPFRRTFRESAPLFRLLAAAALAAALCVALCYAIHMNDYAKMCLLTAGGAVLAAALCACALFGRLPGREDLEG